MRLTWLAPAALVARVGTAAAQEQPPVDWQAIALRAQANGTTEQMVAAAMLNALQAENAKLKAEIARLQQDKKDHPPNPAEGAK